MTAQTLESFTCRSADKFDYANFVVLQRRHDDERGYFMLAIESSYGNGYAFAWTHIGRCFYDFLIGLQDDPFYVGAKMCQGEQKLPDWEATAEAIRKEICEQRRRGELSRDEARAAWPESLFESESDYTQWDCEQRAIDSAYESIVYVPGLRHRDFLALHKAFWPALCEQLKAAKAAREIRLEAVTI